MCEVSVRSHNIRGKMTQSYIYIPWRYIYIPWRYICTVGIYNIYRGDIYIPWGYIIYTVEIYIRIYCGDIYTCIYIPWRYIYIPW